jgi:hypothetical protein
MWLEAEADGKLPSGCVTLIPATYFMYASFLGILGGLASGHFPSAPGKPVRDGSVWGLRVSK